MPRTVSLWGGRFAREGLAGLADKPRPGPPPKYRAEAGQRILAVLDRSPPAGFARWTGPLIATELGDVHQQQVWHFLRAQRTDLDGANRGARARTRSSIGEAVLWSPRKAKPRTATGRGLPGSRSANFLTVLLDLDTSGRQEALQLRPRSGAHDT